MAELTTLAAAADPTVAASAINSWPGVAALFLAIVGPHVVTYMQGRRTKALVTKAATDAAATREQTENEHQDHPTPNLRTQMDAQDDRLGRIETLLTDHIEHATQVDERRALMDERRDQWQSAIEDELARRRRPLIAWRY